jgi:hypothetical protein
MTVGLLDIGVAAALVEFDVLAAFRYLRMTGAKTVSLVGQAWEELWPQRG